MNSAIAQEDIRWHENVINIKISESAMDELTIQKSGELTLTGIQSLDEIHKTYGVIEMRQAIRTDPRFTERHAAYGLNRWFEIRYTSDIDEAEFANMFKSNPSIEIAERKYMYTFPDIEVTPVHTSTSSSQGSNDPHLELQWGLHNTGQDGGTPGADINMFPAWDVTTGNEDVIVLVIDSGIDLEHPDLIPSLWVNPNPGPENGFDGDIHGWNFGTGTGDVQDTGWHGTHVSGTIAAATNNEIGVAGVAGGFGDLPGARIMTAIGGPNIPAAFVYGSDNGAVISNNSWSMGVTSALLFDAITYFKETAGFDADGQPNGPIQGGVVVFSAGNTNNDIQNNPSVQFIDVVNVGSTNRNDLKSSFSNYGSWVNVSAPGSEIISTIPHGFLPNTIYGTAGGTSMAAPHVAGVAALIASHTPGLTSAEVRGRLATGVDNINEFNPDYSGLIGGRINALKALLMEDSEEPPSAITDMTTTGHIAEDHVWLQLTVPDVGGDVDKPFSYDIRLSEQIITADNFYDAERVNEKTNPWFSGMAQTIIIEGLQAETTYFMAIKSRDAFGNISEISNVVEFTTDGSPAIMATETEFVFDLNFGETATKTTNIHNTGEGTLFFSFPFSYQNDGLKSINTNSPLVTNFSNLQKNDKLMGPAARNAIYKYRNGVRSGFSKKEQKVVEFYERSTSQSIQNHSNDNPFDFSTTIDFEDLTLDGFEGILVSEGDYTGELTEVIPDFVLEVNGSDFWASEI